MKRILRSLWRCCWLGAALGLIALAVLLTVARLALPFAEGYQQEIEAAIGDYLGAEVRAAELDLEWHRLGPRLRLDELAVSHPEGDVIRFDTAFVELGFGRGPTDLRIRNVILAGLELDARIDADGQLALWGERFDLDELVAAAEGAEDAAATADELDSGLIAGLLDIERLHLVDATVRITTADGTTHTISDGELRLRNQRARHRLALAARPPEPWGERLALTVDARGLRTGADAPAVRTHLAAADAGLAHWARLLPLPDAAPAVQSGRANLAVWADWDGAAVDAVTAELDVRDLELGEGDAAFALDAFDGLLDWRRSADGWRLRGRDLAVARDGASWSAAATELARTAAGWQGRGDHLAIADVAAAARALALPEPVAARIAEMAPTGRVGDYSFAVADAGGFRVEGDFTDAGWQPAAGWPGVSGLDGRAAITPQGARLDLASRDAAFFHPTLFRDPLRLDRVAGRVDVRRNGDDWVIAAPDLAARNPDIATHSRMRLDLPADDEPWLDMQVDFRDGDAATTSRYLPVGIMFPELIDWLDDAIVDGRVPGGHMLFNGPPGDFPFDDRPGVFEVDFALEDATLDYAPDWPALEELNAQVRFERAALDIEGRGARIYDSPIPELSARFADLTTGALEVDAAGAPRMPDLLRLAAETPLRERLGPFFADAASDDGAAAGMELALAIPVDDTDATRVDGHIDLAGNRLRQPRFRVDLAAIDGRIAFTEDSLAMDGGAAEFHGQPVTIDATTGADGVELSARGDLDAGALLPDAAGPLGERLDGTAPWQVRVGFSGDGPDGLPERTRITARSPLSGTGVDLPAPLGKAADAARELHLELPLTTGSERHLLVARYGDDVGLAAELDTAAEPSLRRGALRFGGGLPELPAERGWHLEGALAELDVAAWAEVLAATRGDEAAAPTAGAGAGELWGGADLDIERAVWGEHGVSDARFRAERDAHAWRFDLASAEAEGSATWGQRPGDGGRLRADFSRVDLGALRGAGDAAGTHPGDVGDALRDPAALPPLEVRVDSLALERFRLDDVVLVTTPVSGGLAIHRLEAGNEHLGLEGQGQWLHRNGDHRSDLRLQLRTSDFGAGLEQAGLAGSGFVGGAGDMSAELDWSGPPWSPEVSSLAGDMRIGLDDGVITAVDPGAARLISLFSLQTLPRRLSLDFSGLLRGGFEYDRIRGQIRAEQGDAHVDRLEMRGPAGRARVDGRIGLAARDFDQQIVFRPGLNYSLPVIGTIAGGPAGGLTVTLLQQLMRGLGADWESAAEVRYALTGSWTEPNVERMRGRDEDSLLEAWERTGPGPAGDPRRP